ncbi:MAG: hypothetical protein NC200_00240 [Candidatus Gastranaerophilales bacterium]|nr:hypothetical protein [Candidatus Gastranaerophilales bacterium]
MITPMTPAYNRNQTSFGMAFKKPSPEVLQRMKEAVASLKPEERKDFVTEIGKIVESQKSNPVPIEQGITSGCLDEYMAVVGNRVYYSNHGPKDLRILDSMKAAAKAADNQNNIHQNMNALKKIFDIKG